MNTHIKLTHKVTGEVTLLENNEANIHSLQFLGLSNYVVEFTRP